MTSVHSEASLLSYKSFSEAGGGFRDGTMGGGGGGNSKKEKISQASFVF